MKLLTFISIVLSFFTSLSSFADTVEVIFLRGEAAVQQDNSSAKKHLKLADRLNESSFVTTGPKSFVKLKFKDGSVLSVSPASKIKIEKIKEESAPLIVLLNGNLRAQVKKKLKNDYSFYIKTRTASLGVRGTDFKIAFNEKNKITTALTFTGKVAFMNAKSTQSFDSPESMEEFDDSYAEVLADGFDNERAKLILPGEFSGSYPGYKEATLPVNLSPLQYKALKNAEDAPDAVAFNESDADADEVHMMAAATKEAVPTNDVLVPRPMEGYTKENYPTNIAPSAGGYLDLDTGFYVIPPEPGNNDQYGKIDSKTGNYVPPEGVKLDPLKGFVPDPNSKKKISAKTLAFVKRMNNSLKNSLSKLKALTRLEAHLIPSFYYDSNITSVFYDRVSDVLHKSSGVFKFDGYLAHKTLDSKNWLIMPKGQFISLYHLDQKTPEVNKQDQFEWNGALELNHRYLIHHRPGHQILEVGRHSIYRDLGGNDRYRFFTEDYYGIFGQEFKLHSRHTTKIYGKYTTYKNFLKEKGEIWSGHFKHTIDMGRRNDLIFDYMFSREFPHANGEMMASEAGLTHSRKYLFDDYTLDTSVKFRYSDFRKLIPLRGEEYLFTAGLKLTREIDSYLYLSLFSNYENNQSDQKTEFKYTKYQIGGDVKFLF